MTKYYILLASLLILISDLYSQSPSWHVLPNSPSTNRMDDISFINENTGWAIYLGGPNEGKIYKTTNGGTAWNIQLNVANTYLRCVGFADSLKGWAGTLGNFQGFNRSPILYKTTNGGNSWDSVTFTTNRPAGLCGISVLDNNNIFACGRVGGPAFFIKTTNGGLNWTSQNMSSYALELVDCKFFTPDSGIVVGGVDTPFSATTGIILFTSNGGTNWIERYRGTRPFDGFWKISFPSRLTGYASINENLGADSLFFIKTSNGGVNWILSGYPVIYNWTQGIGFVNENTGWAGGFNYTYKTTDGGVSWQQENFGININRIRFINDSIGYAVGSRIYKFTSEPIGIHPISTEIPKQFLLYQNYPNPFNPETKIRFEIPPFAKGGPGGFIRLKIFNALGQEIATLINEQLKAGVYEIEWNALEYPSGIYFYELQSESFTKTRKLVLIK